MKESAESGLRRVLGPVDATCVVIGAIVGVGIFFNPVNVAKAAGSAPWALGVWAIGGLIALLGALTFAALGRLYANKGGQYEILRDAYGPFPAFLYVFCNLTAIQAGAVAVIGIIAADNIAVVVNGVVPTPPWRLSIALFLIGSVAAANIVGVRTGASIQNVTVFAKSAALIAVAVLAVFAEGAEVRTPPPGQVAPEVMAPAFTTLFSAVILTMFSYGGWQQGLWMGAEIRDPARNVPRAIILGVIGVVTIYLAANWAYLHLLGYDGVTQAKALAAEAVGAVWSDYGSRGVAAAVSISAYGVLNAQFLTGPRLTHAMARDGKFFRPFARVDGRTRTPVAAILLLAVLSTTLLAALGSDRVDSLMAWVVVIDGVFFALTGLSLIVLGRRIRSGRGPGVPSFVIALLFAGLEVAAVVSSLVNEKVREAAWYGILWVAAAAICYFLFFRGTCAQRPGPNGAPS